MTSTAYWDIRKHDDGEETLHLALDDVRELISKGALSVEDFARPSRSLGEAVKEGWRQIGTIDVFASTASGSRSRRRHAMDADDDYDMTPMIDVVFLLLIFFMVTASFNFQKGLDVPDEKQSSESSEQKPLPGISQFADHLIVGIDNKDNFSFRSPDRPRIPTESIDADNLQKAIKDRSRQQSTTKLLIIADEYASHEALVKLIDSAALADVQDVKLADPKSRTQGSGTPAVFRENP